MLKKALLAILCMMMFTKTAYATENSEAQAPASDAFMFLSVQYPDSISPKEGDVFEVTYISSDGATHNTINVDGTALAGKKGKIKLPAGTYTVTSCVYKGTSEEIVNQGYSYNSQFDATDTTENADVFYICIGKELSAVLQQNSQYFTYILNGEQTTLDNTEEASSEAPASTETAPTEAQASEEPTTMAPLEPDTQAPLQVDQEEEDSYEETEEETTEDPEEREKLDSITSFKMSKGVPIMGMAVIGIIIIYALKKNGRL